MRLTTSVIIGWQLSALGWVWIDRLCALVVAGLIFYLAFSLFRRTLPVLIDERAIDPQALRQAVIETGDVRAVRRARSRWVGSARAVDLVIEVDAELSTADAHEIADRLETMLAERFDVHDVSIHIEPGGVSPAWPGYDCASQRSEGQGGALRVSMYCMTSWRRRRSKPR